jgi:[ribosomal protein S5]-alanine N-acetyltransferase
MIFETQNLILKPILENELSILHRIFADSYVRKHLCDDRVFSLEQVEEMLQQSIKHFEEERFSPIVFLRLEIRSHLSLVHYHHGVSHRKVPQPEL